MDDLRDRVERYLRAHHTMTIATMGPTTDVQRPTEGPSQDSRTGNMPHAATVFYAVDDSLRLVFLSKPSSTHGSNIGQGKPVAVTVSEDYEDWEMIRGVQLWGWAQPLGGIAKATAFALYLRQFPFVSDMMKQPRLAELIRSIGVYSVVPWRVAFTDNSTGVFGRDQMELVVE